MNQRTVISLAQALRRGHRRAVLWAVLIVGLAAGLASFLVLREQVERNLHLIARTVSYSVEVAVAFRDPEAAQEIIAAVARRERVSGISVLLHDDQVFAQVAAAPRGWFDETLRESLATLVPLEAWVYVSRHQQVMARVLIQGDGSQFAQLLLLYLVGAMAAVALTATVVSGISRRLELDILKPLETLRRFTRQVRVQRSFALRAPALAIEEVDALGDDFNALLEEVQAREAKLLSRQARLKQRNEVLSRAAMHDALTGLANRPHFERRLAEAVQRAGSDARLAVLFIDADSLKLANDRFGHSVGDQLLKEIARRLRHIMRDGDCVARLGGDEFAVLVEPLRFAEHVTLLVHKIKMAMELPLEGMEGAPSPRVSIGSAVYPDDGVDPQALLAQADAQMYRAKRQRQNKTADS
jgi:diguanylate cyclase